MEVEVEGKEEGGEEGEEDGEAAEVEVEGEEGDVAPPRRLAGSESGAEGRGEATARPATGESMWSAPATRRD